MPSLWSATRDFISNNWDKVITYNESIQPLLTNEGWQSYNGCLFWNNFAIFSMDYLRSDYYRQFFEHLDKNGGFFYERLVLSNAEYKFLWFSAYSYLYRWSDTLVQTIAASLFLRREELHFFNEIGFEYNSIAHCPLQPQYRKQCVCSPTLSTGILNVHIH
jgi:alpha 1,2-mannosyltransferase